MRFPRWRKMTWVLIFWCAIILVWAIAGGSSANNSSYRNCLHQHFFNARTCRNLADTGTGIGVAAVLLVGFVGFIFFGLI